MEYLVAMFFGFVIAVAIAVVWLAYLVKKIQSETAVDVEKVQEFAEALVNKLIFLKVEEYPEGLFAYDAVTGDYVCKGKDMEELNKTFGERYPNKKGIMVKPDEGEAHDLHSIQSTKQ